MDTQGLTTPEEQMPFVEEALVRAEELRKKKSYNDGIKLLVDALQYGLQKAKIYYRLGNLYFDAGDLNRAEYAYKRALEVNPQYVNAMHNLAVVYKRQKNFSLYVKTYKKSQRMEVLRPRRAELKHEEKARLRRLGLKIIAGILAGLVLLFLILFVFLR